MTDVHADHPETLTPLPGTEPPVAPEPAIEESHHELRVHLPVFEGPLDLLLYLIKKDELDIYDIPIERITRQYLDYLQVMKMLDLEIAGEFLVVASTLVYIKSRTLLPKDLQPPEEDAEEDDPRWDLIRQLVEYKKFKDAAWQLHLKQLEQEKTYQRGAEVVLPERAAGGANSNELGIFDLINAFQKVLARVNQSEDLKEIFEERFTVGDKINSIQQMMTGKERIFFEDLFIDVASRTEIVVTFLALLELIRMKYLRVSQADPFAEIEISHAIDTTPLFQGGVAGTPSAAAASSEEASAAATTETESGESISESAESEPERQPGPLAELHTGDEESAEAFSAEIEAATESEIEASAEVETAEQGSDATDEAIAEETEQSEEVVIEPVDEPAAEAVGETADEPIAEPESEGEPESQAEPVAAAAEEPAPDTETILEPVEEELPPEEPSDEPPIEATVSEETIPDDESGTEAPGVEETPVTEPEAAPESTPQEATESPADDAPADHPTEPSEKPSDDPHHGQP